MKIMKEEEEESFFLINQSKKKRMKIMKEEEEEIANWYDVPIDLLVSVKSRLFFEKDSNNFDVVFPNIPKATVPIPTECPIPHSPWLMSIPDETDGIIHLFHPLYKRETYVMEIPELKNTVIITAKFGWVLMLRITSDLRSLFFFNPFTKAKIELPPLPDEYPCVAVFSFSSTPISSDCIVFGIYECCDDHVSILYIRRGQQTWTLPSHIADKRRCYNLSDSNPVFYDGVFYCLGAHGNLGVFDPEVVCVETEDEEHETDQDGEEDDEEEEYHNEDGGGDDNEDDKEDNIEYEAMDKEEEDGREVNDDNKDDDSDKDNEGEGEGGNRRKSWTVLSKPKSPFKSKSIYECFLLESDGELISVFMGVEGRSLSVFSLDRSRMVWKRLKSLGDRKLFISHRGSLSGKSMVKELGNKIYLMKFSEDNDGVFYSLESRRYHTFGNDGWSSEAFHKLKERVMCTWIEPQSEIPSTEELDWLSVPCTIPRL